MTRDRYAFDFHRGGKANLTKSKRLSSTICTMNCVAKLQFLGPVAVFLAVSAAEAAALALAHFPTSEKLWYVNLKIFQVFQNSAFTLQQPLDLPYSQFFLIALPLFAIATHGLLTNRRFVLALASHLSFIYAGFVFYSFVSSQPNPLSASLAGIAFVNCPNIYMPLFLIGASLTSFLLSHYDYLLGHSSMLSKSGQRPKNP